MIVDAALVTLAVLAAAGCLPVLALVGLKMVSLPLAPLAGAALAALAGGSCIAVPGTLLMWFIVWSSVAAALSVVSLLGRPGHLRRLARDGRREARPLLAAGAVVLVVAAGWALRTVQVANIGFDTRAIWMLHAQWLLAGHAVAYSDIRNHFFVVSHPSYPPLLSAVMALGWVVSGNPAERVATVTVAMVNGCALLVAGWGVVEVARRGMARIQHTARRQQLVTAAGIVIGALVVLTAGGVLGTYATNGYADPLWSLCAVGVVLFGLVLEPTGSDLGLVVILVAVAGYTKVEGMAVAIVLVLLIALRHWLRQRHRGNPLRPLMAAGLGVVALLGWQLETVILGVPRDPSISGHRDGSLSLRARHTWDAAVPHLHVVVLAAVCAVIGTLLLRQLRRRLGLGNDLWAWAALSGAVLVLGGAYVLGPGNIDLWLFTSVDRTTIFVALLGWWMVAVWAVCGTTALLE
jgi:uncharacterized membrane protein